MNCVKSKRTCEGYTPPVRFKLPQVPYAIVNQERMLTMAAMAGPEHVENKAIDESLLELPISIPMQTSTNATVESNQLSNTTNHVDRKRFSTRQEQPSRQTHGSSHNHSSSRDAAQSLSSSEFDSLKHQKFCWKAFVATTITVAALLIRIYAGINTTIRTDYGLTSSRGQLGEQSSSWIGKSNATTFLSYYGSSEYILFQRLQNNLFLVELVGGIANLHLETLVFVTYIGNLLLLQYYLPLSYGQKDILLRMMTFNIHSISILPFLSPSTAAPTHLLFYTCWVFLNWFLTL